MHSVVDRYEYSRQNDDLALAIESLQRVIVRCWPSAALFVLLTSVWAMVFVLAFGLALR